MLLKLEELQHDARTCPRCSNCKWVDHIYMRSHRFAKICPISARYSFNAYSAPGLLDMALGLLENRLDYTPGLVDAVYHCLLCGACDVRCKRNLDIEVLGVLQALRFHCVSQGQGPPPPQRRLVGRVLRRGNRYGALPRRRWLPDGAIPKQADVLFFPGCNAAFAQQDLARATAAILESGGVGFAVMEPERCCGYPLFSLGVEGGLREIMEANLEARQHSGASVLLTGCPHCYHTWKVTYPRLLEKSTEALGFEVLHLSEFALRLLERGALKPRQGVAISLTYHDPCYLGRLGEPWAPWKGVRGEFGTLDPPKRFRRGNAGIYEAPREVLRRLGSPVTEMERVRENAWCCGAGGEVRAAFPDFAAWTARERLEEAKTTSAQGLVTACPYCRESLQGSPLPVLDLSQVLLQALGRETV